MGNVFLCVLGLLITILGVINYKGNISSIHWYNRLKVTKENTKKYGEVMGIGTSIIGISMITTAILQMIFHIEKFWYVMGIGVIVGLVFMFYGQMKYNKGIF